MNAIEFFWKWMYNLLPFFSQLNGETARITSQERTKKLYYRAHSRCEQINSLFKKVVLWWNVVPVKMKSANQLYERLKKRLEKYFNENFVTEVDKPQYSQNTLE